MNDLAIQMITAVTREVLSAGENIERKRERYDQHIRHCLQLQSLQREVLNALGIGNPVKCEALERTDCLQPKLDQQTFHQEQRSSEQSQDRVGAAIHKTRRGRKTKHGDDADAAELSSGAYTKVAEYRPYILNAFVAMGGSGRYIDATRLAFSVLKETQRNKPYDDAPTGPSHNGLRYVTQCASLRTQLVKHGLLARCEDGMFRLTELGWSEVEGVANRCVSRKWLD